ncbi:MULTISPECIES: hypothetical protein [Rheinheimera]|uniref:Uncharacterized protein n=1 Tax=Rheinheimera aquimaris TaxID=412437 RepID=A0ABP3PFB4_9GAMM|nr:MULTISPECIES: hypothetical protein [Rheinheimera]MCB5214986.1 hypothetical protein [Rheinheimera aquimaris]
MADKFVWNEFEQRSWPVRANFKDEVCKSSLRDDLWRVDVSKPVRQTNELLGAYSLSISIARYGAPWQAVNAMA